MFVTKRKLNKKLDLLLKRQSVMMEILAAAELNDYGRKRLTKRWNDLWYDIMEGRYKLVGGKNGEGK